MVENILNTIKLRAVFVALSIHAGLIAAIAGLTTLPRPDGLETAHWLAIGGLAGVYGGMVLGILMVVLPLSSLIRRIRKLMRWRDWILDELPRIIALLPSVLEAIRAFFQALSRGGTVFSAMGEAAKQAGTQPGGSPGVQPAPAPAPVQDIPVPKPKLVD
jgi:hypothetical protein